MYMNYMDLTSDDCMLMFTAGQMNRMRSAFATGGPRFGLLTSNGCSGTSLPEAIIVPEEEAPAVKLVHVYPNPAQNNLVIDLKENMELLGYQAQIITPWGQVVATVRLSQAKTTINITRLAAGMYIIKLYGGSKKYQEKFLKL
jgi:hypothetical protein